MNFHVHNYSKHRYKRKDVTSFHKTKTNLFSVQFLRSHFLIPCAHSCSYSWCVTLIVNFIFFFSTLRFFGFIIGFFFTLFWYENLCYSMFCETHHFKGMFINGFYFDFIIIFLFFKKVLRYSNLKHTTHSNRTHLFQSNICLFRFSAVFILIFFFVFLFAFVLYGRELNGSVLMWIVCFENFFTFLLVLRIRVIIIFLILKINHFSHETNFHYWPFAHDTACIYVLLLITYTAKQFKLEMVNSIFTWKKSNNNNKWKLNKKKKTNNTICENEQTKTKHAK